MSCYYFYHPSKLSHFNDQSKESITKTIITKAKDFCVLDTLYFLVDTDDLWGLDGLSGSESTYSMVMNELTYFLS